MIILDKQTNQCGTCKELLQLITTIFHECIHASDCNEDEKLAYCNEARFIDQVLRNTRPGGACKDATDYDALIDEMHATAQKDCKQNPGTDTPWPTDSPQK